MSKWYDRKGNILPSKTKEEMCRIESLLEDRDYKIVKHTQVGDKIVSTVWLGLDHSFGHGNIPLIFETMLMSVDLVPHVFFGKIHLGPEFDDFQERYATEEEALERHEEIVEMMKSILIEEE